MPTLIQKHFHGIVNTKNAKYVYSPTWIIIYYDYGNFSGLFGYLNQ